MYRLEDGITFLQNLPDHSVDGIFTDPPWGSGPSIPGNTIWKQLLHDMAKECPRILKPTARVLIWVGMRMLGETLKAMGDHVEYKWTIFCQYIPPRFIASLTSHLDPILYFSLPGAKFPHRERCLYQIYQTASRGFPDTAHPCSRPASVVKQILRDWFDTGEYIIDPFAGSDTTGVACRELNLQWDTCEIDPELYKTGQARHSQGILFERK